jgi:hypothetical protein
VDAAGNSLLSVDRNGNVDWIATFPSQMVSTAHIKQLVGCGQTPPPPPDQASVCELPPTMPAEAVPTSVAIGSDGSFYVGELTGFPYPIGVSRVWRVAPGTRHAVCGSSRACTVVGTGFTAVIDLAVGRVGTLHVVELDEAGAGAIELGAGARGGTVNRCSTFGPRLRCDVLADDLSIPTAAAVNRHGTVFVTVDALIPGAARVIALPGPRGRPQQQLLERADLSRLLDPSERRR